MAGAGVVAGGRIVSGFYRSAVILATVRSVSVATPVRISVLPGSERRSERASDQVTEEIRLTRRALREAPDGFSTRTRRVLGALLVGTLVIALLLVGRIAAAQGVRADGERDAAALATALRDAEDDAAALATAIEQTTPAAADARALAEVVALRQDDLSAEAVADVALAAEALAAALAEPAPEPALSTVVDDAAALPSRYVAVGGDERAALRAEVAAEIDRLDALGRRATERVGELAVLTAAVSDAASAAARAAIAVAPTTVAGSAEAGADARAGFDAAVAGLAALGETPSPGAETRQAFTTYFAAADTLRRSHREAVLAREEAERVAAEQAAAEQAAAEQEAAEREADERDSDLPWWWRGDEVWPPGQWW